MKKNPKKMMKIEPKNTKNKKLIFQLIDDDEYTISRK